MMATSTHLLRIQYSSIQVVTTRKKCVNLIYYFCSDCRHPLDIRNELTEIEIYFVECKENVTMN